MRTSRSIPWYLHPVCLWGVILFSFVLQLVSLSTDYAFLKYFLGAIGLAVAAYYVLWAYLLYEYLAPSSHDASRHRPGGNKLPLTVILASMALAILLTMLGLNTEKPNEAADLLVFPLFLSFFTINWKACDLLVDLERNLVPTRSKTLSFIAMCYLPIFVFWYYSRLKTLKRKGVI